MLNPYNYSIYDLRPIKKKRNRKIGISLLGFIAIKPVNSDFFCVALFDVGSLNYGEWWGDMGNLDVVILSGFERIKKGDESIGS